jgi:hypothetical protein
VRTSKWGLSEDHYVQDDPQGVNIGLLSRILRKYLILIDDLRRHVSLRPIDSVDWVRAWLRKSKVTESHFVVLSNEDIV